MPGQRYRVVHRTECLYGATMLDGYSVACVLARPTPSQTVASSVVTTYPEPDEYDERDDVFGNRVVQFGLHRPHDGLVVEAITEARVWAQELPRADVAWERASASIAGMRGPTALDVAPFVAPSRFVTIGPNRRALFDLASSSFTPGRGIVDATTALCAAIFETFMFDPSFTEVSSPLDVVLGDRRGVCQDFAHLAVGALRTIGLAARYVSGYIETEPSPGEPKTIGADASHAWCSVWVPDHGWLDFDPTNGIGPSSSQSLSVSVDVARI